jgi:hypothetical protein
MARHRPPAIRTGPVHRRDWSWEAWGRRCVCGLPWRCPDAGSVPPVAEPAPVRAVGVASVGRAGRTVGGDGGRAVLLTMAGEWRGNGGRWPVGGCQVPNARRGGRA